MLKNRIGFFLIIWLLAVFVAVGGYMSFMAGPTIELDKLSGDYIENVLFSRELNSAQKQNTIVKIANAISKLPQEKQRTLWHKLAVYSSGQQRIDFNRNETSCWPQGTVNSTILDSLRSTALDLAFLEKYTEAEKVYRYILSIAPENTEQRISYARFLKDRERYEEAHKELTTVLNNSKPDCIEMGEALYVFYDINCFEDGILASIDFIKKHKLKGEVYYWLELGLMCYRKEYSLKLAEAYFKKAEICSRNTKNRNSLAESLFFLGLVAETKNEFSLANDYYQQVLKLCPDYTNFKGQLKNTVDCLKNKKLNIRLAQLQRDVTNGDIDSQYELGLFYLAGKGVKKDFKKAVELFRNAAIGYNSNAMYHLGYCLKNGLGVKQNQAEAVKWFNKGAEYNNHDCQYSLGMALLNGDGLEKDRRKAFLYFLEAARNGHADAQLEVGKCYLDGIGVIPNQVKAAKWLRISAEQGNNAAMNLVKQHDFVRKVTDEKWIQAHSYTVADWIKQGLRFKHENNPQVALECYMEALYIYKQKKEFLNQAIILTYMGGIIVDSKSIYDKKKSLEYINSAIAILKEHCPHEKKRLILAYLTQGDAYSAMDNEKAALKCYSLALKQYDNINLKKISKCENNDICSNIIALYKYILTFERDHKVLCSDNLILKLQKFQTQIPKDEYILKLQVLNLLSVAYSNRKELEKSLAVSQKALELSLEKFGPSHQRTALSYAALAKDYYALKQKKKAIIFMKKAQAIFVALYGATDYKSRLVGDFISKWEKE